MLIPALLAFLAPQSSTVPAPPTETTFADAPFTVKPETPGSPFYYSEATGSLELMSSIDPRWNFVQALSMPSGYRINSFSRGTGVFHTIMVDSNHVHAHAPTNGWSVLHFAVEGFGPTAPGAYGAEITSGSGLTGDIFSYTVPGSSYFAADQTGIVHKIREGSQIGVGTPAGIDNFLAGYSATPGYIGEFDEVTGAGTLTFYFTVHHSSGDYSGLPAAWGADNSNWRRPSTIFEMKYEESSGWTLPTVWRQADDLGIPIDTIITGLCVMDPNINGAPYGAPGIEVMLSAANPILEMTLWICGRWIRDEFGPETPYKGPLLDEDGGLFSVSALQMDASQERIVALCANDPGDDAINSPHHRLQLERCALPILGSERLPTRVDFSLQQIKFDPVKQLTRFRASALFLDPAIRGIRLKDRGTSTLLWSLDNDNRNTRKASVLDFRYLNLPAQDTILTLELIGASQDPTRDYVLRLR